MASTHASRELIFNQEEWWGAEKGQTKLRWGPKVRSGWAIITGPSQEFCVFDNNSKFIGNNHKIITRQYWKNT